MRREETEGATSGCLVERGLAYDELNLAEFPFSLLTERAYRGNSFTVVRETRDPVSGACVRQEWSVKGNETGLPTVVDMDVYVALMRIAARDGIDQDRRVFFSRYELVQMQKHVPGLSSYKQLEKSLDRLVGVTIYAKDAFLDAKSRRRVSKAFGLLDSYQLEDSRKSRRRTRGGEGDQLSFPFQKSWVVLNTVLHNQWINGGVQDIDVCLYYDLQSRLARRLYRYLDRMRQKHGSVYEIDLATLSRLMPLHDPRPSRQMRDLARAHAELTRRGYLEKVDEPSSGCEKRLVYFFKEPKLDPKAQLLVDRGVTPSVARDLAERFPDRIAAKVEAFDRLEKGATRNPAGYLRRSIEGDWSESPAKKVAPAAKTRKAALPPMTDEDRRSALFRERFQALEEGARSRLSAAANELARKEGVSELRLPLVTARKLEELFFKEFGEPEGAGLASVRGERG